MERCPCCNSRLRQTAICPRCRAELSAIIDAEKSAAFWLSQAMQCLKDDKIEQSSVAINRSLFLKKTEVASIFREFLIHQQCRAILGLLAQTLLLPAKSRLYHARLLTPYSKKLQQLNSFTDYLLTEG